MTTKFLRYYLTAGNGKGHGMHSPFVFDFITRVLNDHSEYQEYQQVEALRKQLVSDSRVILVEDLGAGSSTAAGRERSVNSIARNAAKPKKYGQLLFRIIRYYGYLNILELGTSLGITTAYMALANKAAHVTTMEGAASVAEIAKKNLKTLGCENVEQVAGNFDVTLPQILKDALKPQLVFIDGNHRYEPTIRYFHELLKVSDNDTMLIFDDIHWSEEMERAWEEIKQHPSVSCTIDLFFIGIVLFRREFHEPRHFVVRY